MREAARRTVVVRQRSGDLRSEFSKLLTAAKKMGDSDFATKMEARLKKLKDVTQEYDRDVAGLGKHTDEWRAKNVKLQKSFDGLTLALGNDKKAMNAKRDAWEKMSDVHERALRDNKEYDASLRKLTRTQKVVTKQTTKHRRELSLLTRVVRGVSSPFKKMGKSFSGSFRRMDGTVKLVITLIATAGTMMAALGSAASGAGIAIASAGAMAFAGLSPLLGVLAPLVYGLNLVKSSLTDEFGDFTTEKIAGWAPEAAAAMENFADVVKKIDASALFEHWNDSLATFVNTLADSLEFDAVAAAIGDAFSKLTDGLTAVLDSSAWTNFVTAVEGPLTEALGNLLAAAGPLLSTLLQFMTAAAPFAVILSEQFLLWAENLEKAFAASVESGEFASFMQLAVDSLTSVLDLLGSVGSLLGTVFEAGAPAGIVLLDTLTGLVDTFNTWLGTFEGQAALNTFFTQGLTVVEALLGLLGDLGMVLGDLVTPAVVNDLVEFLGAVGDILPVLGDLISLFAEAHVLDVLTAAIKTFGAFLKPLIPPLGKFLAILGEVLIEALDAIAPSLALLGEAFGTIFEALSPLLPVLGNLLVSIIQTLVPLIVQLIEAWAPLAEQLLPLLVPLFEALVPALGQIIDAVIAVVSAILPFVTTMAEALAPMLPTIVDLIGALAEIIGDILVHALDILMPFLELFVPMMGSITPILEILLPLVELLGVLLDVFFTIIDAILAPLLDFIENTDILSSGMEDLSAHIDVAIGWIEDITQAIQDWLENDLGKWAKDAGAAIEDTFNGIVDWFEGIGDDIGAIFNGIGDAIESAFKGAFNAVARAWNNTVGSLSWSVPTWVPGIGGNSISAPKMPTWYAAGGIATTPTIAGFGEAGAEALVPLNRPLSQVDPSVRALSAFAQGKSGPSIAEGAIVINAKSGDGRLIAESVLDRIVAYSR